MSDIGQRIRKARKAASLSQQSVATALGIARVSVTQWEIGVTKPDLQRIEAISTLLDVSPDWLLTGATTSADAPMTTPLYQEIDGLPVSGVINAGSWRDTSLIDEDAGNERIIPVARDARFPNAKQYALEVQGDSMNRRFPNGSFVTCVNWQDSGLALRPRLCVHVERVDAASRVECTVKVYAERDGKRWLDPDSTNAKNQPIEINGNEGVEIFVKGLVTGFWMPMEI